MTIQLFITQKDINNGLKQDCSECPIALSFEREFKKIYPKSRIFVDTQYNSTKVIISDKSFFFEHPRIMKDFIKNFDAGFRVAPFVVPFSVELKSCEDDF